MDFIKRKSIGKVKFKRAIKNAVSSYTKLVDKLKDYGITKKEELTGSLAEYYCKELFGVKLTDEKVQNLIEVCAETMPSSCLDFNAIMSTNYLR